MDQALVSVLGEPDCPNWNIKIADVMLPRMLVCCGKQMDSWLTQRLFQLVLVPAGLQQVSLLLANYLTKEQAVAGPWAPTEWHFWHL